MAKINRRGAKYCLGQNWRYGGMKKNRARGKDKKVVSNPGPRPPYHALPIIVRMISGVVSKLIPRNRRRPVLSAMRAPYAAAASPYRASADLARPAKLTLQDDDVMATVGIESR